MLEITLVYFLIIAQGNLKELRNQITKYFMFAFVQLSMPIILKQNQHIKSTTIGRSQDSFL